MSKKNQIGRLEAISSLIQEEWIQDQNRLVDLLKTKFGIETNQSVLSRDLRKLGVIKRNINQTMVYTLPDYNVTNALLKLAVLDVKFNESLIVIRTYPALAGFVGDFIDGLDDLPILGSLAGENVVFVTCASSKEIKPTYALLCKKLHFTPQPQKETK